jgi:hypothetical protein
MPGADLVTLVHDELCRLPTPRAPGTLLPRVVGAAHAWMARPWYARDWFTWPIGLQVLSMATLAVIVAGAVVMAPAAEQVARTVVAALASRPAAAVATAVQHFDAVVTTARVLWRALAAPLMPYAFVVVALMCLACAAFGTALNRVAFGRT